MVHVFAAASELGDGVACLAMAERLSSLAARGGGDANEKMDCEPVGQARGGVHVVASSARTATAHGHAVRRPATGGATHRTFSENGQHCSLPETLIQ